MTQTLSPSDTGEIRRDPGETTTNLMFVLNPPSFRRPDATTELPIIDGGCRTVVPNDEDFEPSRPIPHPDPLPPPPPPTPNDMAAAQPIGPLKRVLTDAEQDRYGVFAERRSVRIEEYRLDGRTPGYSRRHAKPSRWALVRATVAAGWAIVRDAL